MTVARRGCNPACAVPVRTGNPHDSAPPNGGAGPLILVKLQSNGDYWQAVWTVRGKRCARSLGPKHALARPAAETRCMEIMLQVNRPEKRKGGKSSGVWTYVSPAQTQALIAACPNGSWRLLVGLCRWAGLRAGEARRLRWGSIDWERHVLAVVPTTAHKTSKQAWRSVPIVPELYAMLTAEFATAKSELVCDNLRANVARDLRTIIFRAGLPAWEKPTHNLRKSRVSEWMERFPAMAVSSWCGHTTDVAAKHYFQVLDSTLDAVTQRNLGNVQDSPCTMPKELVDLSLKEPENSVQPEPTDRMQR